MLLWGCGWHAVRSVNPLHLQSGYRSEQRLVGIKSLFQPSPWLELPFPRCWRFLQDFVSQGGDFHVHHLVSLLAVTGNHHRQTLQTLFPASGLPPVTQDIDRFFPPFIRFLLATIYSQSTWWGCWGLFEYSLGRSQAHHRTHSNITAPL